MKTVAPDYFNSFACIKGACRHSCCIGWDIYIDDDTCNFYSSVSGEMGDRLAKNISRTDEGACFRMRENGRCPFLNDEGLCDIIIDLGEEHLGEICADHPRFRNYFTDRTEIGLGLCCEAAGRLILMKKEPVKTIVLEDDGADEALYEEEAEVLDIREALIEIAQDRTLSMRERIAAILDEIGFDEMPIGNGEFAEALRDLERLDEAWTARLDTVADYDDAQLAQWELPFEQLLVYFLWRHLPAAAEDDAVEGRILMCLLLWETVRAMFAAGEKNEDELVEIVRLCSSEIEYSDENIDKILQFLSE